MLPLGCGPVPTCTNIAPMTTGRRRPMNRRGGIRRAFAIVSVFPTCIEPAVSRRAWNN